MPKDCTCPMAYPSDAEIQRLRQIGKVNWTMEDWAIVFFIKFGHSHMCKIAEEYLKSVNDAVDTPTNFNF